MDNRLLTTFVTIAGSKSFTQAAEKLGYAQSSITAQVKSLEDELGTKLFERLGKTISLTPAGEKLLPYAKQILRLSEEAKCAVAPSGAVRGPLAVGAPESLCAVRLLPLFKAFRNQYPDVEFTLKFGGSYQFPDMLKENEIDVAIFIDRTTLPADLISVFCAPEPVVLLASPEHSLANSSGVCPHDLFGEEMILTDAGCSYRGRFLQLLGEAGVTPKSILDSGSNEVMKQLAASGLGIALLPRVAAVGELASGKLVELPWAGEEMDLYTHVVYHKDKWVSPALGAFLRLAVEVLNPKNPSDFSI